MRDGSLNSNLPRRSGSVIINESENDEDSTHRNQRVINPGIGADLDHNSVTANSSAEINRLSSELNSRIYREMDEMMNSVSVQIQRAKNDAISNQVLPHIQNVIKAGSGHVTRKGWNVPAERPEPNPEVQRNPTMRNILRNEQDEGYQNGELPSHNVHDRVSYKALDFDCYAYRLENSRFPVCSDRYAMVILFAIMRCFLLKL